MRKPRYIVAALAAAAVAAVCYSHLAAAPQAAADKAQIGQPAPDFELKDVYGKPFKLSEFKDRIVVLEWINRECPVSAGCHDKKIMQDTYKKYAEKGVVWLAIDSTAAPAPAKPENNRVYAAQKGLVSPILHDPEGKAGRAYAAKTTPHMFVIDKAGILVYDGAIDDKGQTNYVAAALDDLLAGKPVGKSKTEPYGCTVKYAKGPA